MEGQIVKIVSNDFFVVTKGKEYICKLRGKFRKEGITPKVGDYVFFDEKQKVINEIYKRKNELDRPLVSNIDIALLVTSLKKPDFSTNILDKLLVISTLNNIKPIICLTKKDLLSKEEYKDIKKVISYYKKLGYKVIYNKDIHKLKKIFKNKTVVLTGQTGAGKSSLMNRLDKNLNFETNEISKALGRGKHTTRYVTLVELYKGKVVDTPGFSSIDLSKYTNEEIKESFIEFKNYNCPYKNCMHINETNCLVKKQVGKTILKSRYENYKKFIEKR